MSGPPSSTSSSSSGTGGAIASLWQGKDGENGEWYKKAESYWGEVESSVDGMLGGFSQLSQPDVAGSRKFMQQLKRRQGQGIPAEYSLALDCGAGIGRVSKDFLLSLFQHVDLVEPNPKFLQTARETLPPGRPLNFYCAPLQQFTPVPNRYDVIWCQWVIIYLTDGTNYPESLLIHPPPPPP